MHKIKERPFAEGSRDYICRGARAQSEKLRDKNILGGVPSHQRKRLRVPNTFHARYIIGGSQTENKVYSFFPPYFPCLAVSTIALHTNTFQGIYYLTI